ncbi:MAG TPA: hypothetical protein VNY83_08180 [Solirubrobacterales bacterium]|nr:hypothetical protein [Solirubrobacterales bacterium]
MAAVLAATAVLSSVSATAILAAGNAITIRAGNLVLQAEGVITPKALPKNRMTPISLHARGSVATADGSHVPPAQTVHLQVDRHFRIESTGLPSCTAVKIKASAPSQAIKACGPALIGRGSGAAQVEFPESAPFSAKGPLLGFNGPRVGGYPEMLWYVYVAVPVPTALVWVAKLSKDSGKYAYRISQTIPKLAGGSGSLTGFEVTVGRKWTYRGRQHSYLSAECPDGRFIDQFEAAFGGGTNLTGTLVNSCQSKG